MGSLISLLFLWGLGVIIVVFAAVTIDFSMRRSRGRGETGNQDTPGE